MSAGTYTPQPGTVAFRALAHLETLPAGAEIMTSALAEAIGAPALSVGPCLEPALRGRAVFRRQKDTHARSPWWWSLTDHSSLPRQRMVAITAADGEPLATRDGNDQRGSQEPRAGLTAKETTQRGAGRAAKPEGAGDDAKRDGGPASPGGSPAPAPVFIAPQIRVTLQIECTAHQAQRIAEFVHDMREVAAS